jgi:hypothetical protein
MGKVTFKSNGDEALSDESLLKSTTMKHLTRCKSRSDEAFNASKILKQ